MLDRALSQSDDAIGVAFGKSLVVRYDDDETVLGDGGEGVHGILPAREVKRARGFVCEQDARFLDYGPGDGDALGLSARELAGHPVLEARQANGLERLGHSCVWTTADKALDLRIVDACEVEGAAHVVTHVQIADEGRVLEHEANVLSPVPVPVRLEKVPRGPAVDLELSLKVTLEAAQDVEERCLAAARASQDADETGVCKGKGDLI